MCIIYAPLRLTGLNFTNAEFLDKSTVAHNILVAEVCLEASPLSDQHEQSTSAVVVFLVGANVIGDLLDSRLHDCDLNFRRTGIPGCGGVSCDDLCFLIWTQGHGVNGLRDNSNPKELSTAQF